MKKQFIAAAIVSTCLMVVLALQGKLFTSSCCGPDITASERAALALSAASGDMLAMWKLHEDASHRGDTAGALRYLEQLSRLGDNNARYLYFSTAANDAAVFARKRALAIGFLMDAANNGHAISALFLGQYFENGEFGFEKNIDKAITWYGIAAASGNEQAAGRVVELAAK